MLTSCVAPHIKMTMCLFWLSEKLRKNFLPALFLFFFIPFASYLFMRFGKQYDGKYFSDTNTFVYRYLMDFSQNKSERKLKTEKIPEPFDRSEKKISREHSDDSYTNHSLHPQVNFEELVIET